MQERMSYFFIKVKNSKKNSILHVEKYIVLFYLVIKANR